MLFLLLVITVTMLVILTNLLTCCLVAAMSFTPSIRRCTPRGGKTGWAFQLSFNYDRDSRLFSCKFTSIDFCRTSLCRVHSNQ